MNIFNLNHHNNHEIKIANNITATTKQLSLQFITFNTECPK